ncbi:hypothetical protein VNO77_21453 [Canavalia gladiata]|uniref:Uncharacterized protein n=1 Tax=Canavalia gladiata TaxID=3824 RepID=A0AAN9QMB1_CANGL
MKQGSILLIVWAFFTLFSYTYGNGAFCPLILNFDGSCPTGTSGRTCLQEFQAKLPNGNPNNCSCENLGTLGKRRCTCNVICRLMGHVKRTLPEKAVLKNFKIYYQKAILMIVFVKIFNPFMNTDSLVM